MLIVGTTKRVSISFFFSQDAKRALMLTGRAAAFVVAKREANDKPSDDDDCVIYRYGSFCTGIEVFGESLCILYIF